jgi:hypothetical protein
LLVVDVASVDIVRCRWLGAHGRSQIMFAKVEQSAGSCYLSDTCQRGLIQVGLVEGARGARLRMWSMPSRRS